jgi:hypothetical protein
VGRTRLIPVVVGDGRNLALLSSPEGDGRADT